MALRRKSISLLILTFFGLTYDYRLTLFGQIHEICFHGQGGYDWNTVYNMPIWLRTFTFNKMREYYDKQNEESKKAEKSWTNKSNLPKPPTPSTSYSTRASKK